MSPKKTAITTEKDESSATANQPLESASRGNGGETQQYQEAGNPTLTTNQGVAIADNQNSLKAFPRGPTLLEDFILREKITHFDHERIPERVVHARGAGAYGYFQPYDDRLAEYTVAKFLTDPAER
ncbi:MAG TPA: catalase, partial [Polyangiaceae bacterium]|nr:catalase [Polyangiaceae bacterium]